MRPFFTPDAIDRIVRSVFGLTVSQRALPSYSDLNTALEVDGKTAWVLKIANNDESEAILDFQQRALLHLATADPGLRVPKIRLTVEGHPRAVVVSVDGERYHAWMVSFLEDRFLADLSEHPPALLRDVGRYFGRLDRALTGYEHTAMHRVLRWDLRQASLAIPCLPAITSPARRRMAENILDRFLSQTAAQLDRLRMQVIHNDANDHNVLVDACGPEIGVTGVIDFGDMIHTALVCEPAIASAYALLGKSEPVDVALQIFEGFNAVFPLTKEELAPAFDLIQLRLAMSVCYSTRERTLAPDNAYLAVSEAPAWEALERLTRLDRAAIQARFLAIRQDPKGFENPSGLTPIS
jgi:Ser/Thr protein kinase RdoA (MazF antagonist)